MARRGQSVVEYATLLALIVLLVLFGGSQFGEHLHTWLAAILAHILAF